jgi:peptidoglycan/xylan/chitin deacetylase (PgdA/CDA1 family)
MPLALLYHDVVPAGRDDDSGFPGPGAARYKLAPAEFAAHLDAIRAAVPRAPGKEPLLTFDDGGASSYDPIAGLLEAKGWRGRFFITTDHIGRPGFVTAGQLRELHARGHVLGSHSCSHPERMSRCPRAQVVEEWQCSREVLADILGAEVTSASVPGGFYSRQVAEAAAEAGLTQLFNSEPTMRASTVGGLTVLGRYTIYRGMSARSAAALAVGRWWPRMRQAVLWSMKKAAKGVGGQAYLRLRHRVLRRAYGEGQACRG